MLTDELSPQEFELSQVLMICLYNRKNRKAYSNLFAAADKSRILLRKLMKLKKILK